MRRGGRITRIVVILFVLCLLIGTISGLSTSTASADPDPGVELQLAIILDGSYSINSTNPEAWSIIVNGLAAAIDNVAGSDRPRLLMSPRGKPLSQARVRDLAACDGAVIVCGRFEGVDERVIEARNLEEISIGDFVLSGGEPAALTLLDAVIRLLPGVMGKSLSGEHESFEDGLLEHPHYTRPREWETRAIPEVLLSGDHAKIRAWQRAQAEQITRERRPDLWSAHKKQKE